MPAAGADDDNGNDNIIIFTIKGSKLYVPVVTLSGKDNQKLSKLLSKRLERSVYWNEYKSKSENKIQQTSIDVFSNQILLESIGYLFLFLQIKMTLLKDLKLEDNMYQKE